MTDKPKENPKELPANSIAFKGLIQDSAWKRTLEYINELINDLKNKYFDLKDIQDQAKVFDKINNYKELKDKVEVFIINSSKENN